MLGIYHRLSDLDFEKLMALYQEGNRENALEQYPSLEPEEALRKIQAGFESYLREDFFSHKRAFYCLWEEAGQYLSALRLEPYEDGLLIQALETHPAHRRRGYASCLIRAVQKHLSDSVLYSHVHKRNQPSLAVHRACGFQEIADSARYIDGTVTGNACTLRWKP